MAVKTNPLYGKKNKSTHKPEWLKVRYGSGDTFNHVRHLIKNQSLNTVCESAHCPNLGECWSRGTATFMVLGNICTRSCKFCNVAVGRPQMYDLEEPKRVARAVKKMDIHHAVITMVARDDLKDSGAIIVAETIKEIKRLNPNCTVEALISDLKGIKRDLDTVLEAKPDILNHNLETVKRLQKEVRVQAKYERSLQILDWAKQAGFITKSGIMVGLGESLEEIVQVMQDLVSIECKILTIGQYLAPSKTHYPVARYYRPEEFADLKELGLEYGFLHVESGPLVRSSYHAEKAVLL